MRELGKVLLEASSQAGITINEEQAAAFVRYGQLLIEWNQKFNLTSITDVEGIALKHFVDSMLCASYADFSGELKVLDVGTGAGFPGLPLKLLQPALSVTLLDSLQKRVNFLQAVVDELMLKSVLAVHGRAEELGHDPRFRGQYQRVVSRAVARLAVLVEYCLPFVQVGGQFIAMKGSALGVELEESLNAISLLGGQVTEVREYHLPILGDQRTMVVISKVKASPVKYPRKAGTPEKKPL
ncbi:MAG TPA: 16S rRNA (guanine(527)-N(7))-methyltransferase RsmG [Bacillota bacterium]|nr:16S rRNA (guanine(527)-N(7))-methyltransferase RsmG [Bacillota bacterium]